MPTSPPGTSDLFNHYSAHRNQHYVRKTCEKDWKWEGKIWRPMSRNIEPSHDIQREKDEAKRYCGNHLPCLGHKRDDATDNQRDKELPRQNPGYKPEYVRIHLALSVVWDDVVSVELKNR